MDNEKFIRALSCWQSDIELVPLEGGITNHNFLVTEQGSGSARQYVVRLGDDIPVHHILRFNEVAASKAAHAAGLSPAIRHHEPGALVMDYVPSTALTPELVRNDAMLERLVPLIHTCHRDVPKHLRGASVVFWVFHVVRDYAGSLKDADSVHLHKLPALLNAANVLEAAASPHEIVFGHNDLLSANLLDDGTRLWLIDWEYAGFNTPLFDLGGLASNNEISEKQEYWLLDAYYETDVTDELWRRYQAMKCASLLRESLWSMISEVYATVDFDYAEYTKSNLQNFESSYADFKRLYT